jgi:hypothetical protein
LLLLLLLLLPSSLQAAGIAAVVLRRSVDKADAPAADARRLTEVSGIMFSLEETGETPAAAGLDDLRASKAPICAAAAGKAPVVASQQECLIDCVL